MTADVTDKQGVRKKSALRDAVIIASIAIIALVAWWAILHASAGASSRLVQVRDGDGNSTYLPLDQNTRFVAATELGTNTVVVQDGTVHIEDADCKNKDCEKQGTIDTPGEMLICLPHKLYVQIVDENGASTTSSGNGYDVVSS